MLIQVGCNLISSYPVKTHAILMLYLHPSLEKYVKKQDCIITDPIIPLVNFIDSFGNKCARIEIPKGGLSIRNEAIVSDSGIPNLIDSDAKQLTIAELPDYTLQFLLASRYCEVDLMGEIAWELFGGIPNGRAKTIAISNWVHSRISFDYKLARCTRTALETYTERVGVCRDFTHLAITLFRALHIPARYATGYLGDIGIEPLPFSMDFSSWAEVYLSGKWHIVDPRHNIPRIGYIPMAYGRDASDVALITTFGDHSLDKFEVWTNELFIPN